MCESENTPAFIYAKERPLHDNVPNTLKDPNENVKYKKVGFFGKGGYASCYEFQNTSTKVKYAIKVISKRRGPNPNDTRHRYKAFDEAAIHANLEHENIVRLYGSFEDEFNVYLILEPCRYGTLSNVLMNRFRISPIEARYYLHQIASGCTYLHRHLVVHRDLKVNNILIDESMTVKICDFGFAVKLSDVNAKSNIICGTSDYLAPEVVDRQGHGFEVDAWAIGCIAYHLLVGQVPFKTASKEETFGLIKTAKYNPIPDHFRLPESALNLISGALQLNPDKRLTVSQILKHEFLVQPPEIPPCLPVALLSSLNRNGENVTMEEYVTRVVTLYQGIESSGKSGSYCGFFYRFICGSTCCRP